MVGAYRSIVDELLERFILPLHSRQEPVLLKRVGVHHLVHTQCQTRVAILVHLLDQLSLTTLLGSA